MWETVRLRRCRGSLVGANYADGLQALLHRLLTKNNIPYADIRARKLALAWFVDKEAKQEVRGILRDFDLDESMIEAEAVRLSFRDLEIIDKLLMGLEARRDKALGCIANYREAFGQQLRETSDRLIEKHATDVPCLEDASVKTSPE